MSEQEKIPIGRLNMDKKLAGISKWKVDAKDKKDVKDGWIKALRLGELTGKVVKGKNKAI